MTDVDPSGVPRWVHGAAVLYGLPFVAVGILHFVQPEIFEPLVPPYLGWPWFWVHITGYTEVALGLAIMLPRTRRVAGWLMAVQLGLLYLANLHMWMADLSFQGVKMDTVGHIVRLGVQLLLAGVAVGFARSAGRGAAAGAPIWASDPPG